MFRAVYLPAGVHTVKMFFRPWWLWPSLGLTLLGLLAGVALVRRPAADEEKAGAGA